MVKGFEEQAKQFKLSSQVLGSQCRDLARGRTVIERCHWDWCGGWIGKGETRAGALEGGYNGGLVRRCRG